MIFQFPEIAILRTKEKLYDNGQRIAQKSWQSQPSPDDTWELLNHSVGFVIPPSEAALVQGVKPNLPWADEHFKERVGGVPLNPPPSHERWPFATKNNKEHTDSQGRFSHTYPERFWPKHPNDPNDPGIFGIHYPYGDFGDLINQLENDPSTRQAYLPIFFPEDTGAVQGQRVPCTIGYHFIIRNNYLHITYYIRSCDYMRHFRDDIYLACKLVHHIIGKLSYGSELLPGTFNMHITSLHCFYKEKELLKQSNK